MAAATPPTGRTRFVPDWKKIGLIVLFLGLAGGLVWALVFRNEPQVVEVEVTREVVVPVEVTVEDMATATPSYEDLQTQVAMLEEGEMEESTPTPSMEDLQTQVAVLETGGPQPTAEPEAEEDVPTPAPTVTRQPFPTALPGGVVLDGGRGVFYGGPFFDGPEKSLLIPEGGYAILAIGPGDVDPIGSMDSDESIGNIVLFLGTNPDGSTPSDLNRIRRVNDYVSGAVGYTIVYTGSYDEALVAVDDAVENMGKAPNCGQEGCEVVFFYTVRSDGTFEKEKITFNETLVPAATP